MKTVTITEMKKLAEYYGGTFTNDLMPAIEFNEYGIEATEIDGEDCYGFKFYGHPSQQEKVIDLWNELTEHESTQKLMTIELAKSLIGKKIEVAYTGNNGYEYAEVIELAGVEERKDKAIGQSTTHYLLFKKIGDPLQHDMTFEDEMHDYYYEWQGLFRATGSAHKVYLKKVIE